MDKILDKTLNNKKPPFIPPELTVKDLSYALYETSLQLERSNNDLLHSQRQQQLMFSNISHDLRSPITAIKNTVDYLLTLDSYETEETTTLLNIISRRIEYLDKLIQDAFLLTKIDSSLELFHLEETDLGLFLENVFYTYTEDTRFHHCNFHLDIPPDFAGKTLIDCNMLVRVFDNLFINALKYSRNNLSITLSAKINSNATATITVADTGIGIAKEHLNKIFDSTYMVSNSRTPANGTGSGLGLSITKSIIERLGGTIWCDSILDKGTTFYFTLPLLKV